MTTTEHTTPLPTRAPSTPFRQLVEQLLLGNATDDNSEFYDGLHKTTVDEIVQAHEATVRPLMADIESAHRTEATAHEQHRTSWAMLEFVQQTARLDLRRMSHMYAQLKADAQFRENLRYITETARAAGRPITVSEIDSITASAAVIPMDTPTVILGFVRDHTYRYGVFRGPDQVTVQYPFVGYVLVSTNRETERILEPAFLLGNKVQPASRLAAAGVNLLSYM